MGQYFFAVRGGVADSEGVECQSLGVAEAYAATFLASKVQPDGPNHVMLDAVIRDDQGAVLSCVSVSVTTLRKLR